MAEVKKIADGRIFSGAQAKELGLIDELGNFNDAVLLAAELAAMKKDKMPRLVYPPKSDRGLLHALVGETKAQLVGILPETAPVLSYIWDGR